MSLHPSFTISQSSIAASLTGLWAITDSGLSIMSGLMQHATTHGRELIAAQGPRLHARRARRAAGDRVLAGDLSAAPHAVWSMGDDHFEGGEDAHVREAKNGDLIGVLPVSGALVTHASMCWEGYDSLKASGRAMIALGCTRIVLRLNSPGGSCQGLAEFCAEIRAWREAGIEVYGVVDVEACSAAYAIAAQCDELYVSPSSLTGHIGTFTRWVDVTGAMEKEGIRGGYISEGANKTFFAGNNTEIPFDEQKRMRDKQMRPIVKHFYDLFLTDVEAGRGKRLNADAARETQAMVYPGEAAIEAGLADGTHTMETLLMELTGIEPGIEEAA